MECAFGILSNKWRVFHTAILLNPQFVDILVKAACVLHNFVRLRDGYKFEDTLTCEMDDIPVRGTGGTSRNVQDVRNTFSDFFLSPAGCVPWQYDMV